MINEILDYFKEIELQNNILFLNNKEEYFITYIIYLKYLCDKGEYDLYEVASNDELYEITPKIDYIKTYYLKNKKKLPINVLLLKLKNIDLKELLLDFLDYIDKPIYMHNKNDKIAYINIEEEMFKFYNKDGNATYYIKSYNQLSNFKILKAFDEILGIKNNYKMLTYNYRNKVVATEIKNYDYIYMYDNSVRFSKTTHNILEDIRLYLYNNKNIVLLTNYKKISNFREGRFIARAIKTIIIDNDKTTILFNINSNEISIINYDRNKIKDINSIITNNRKQKDILIKINIHDLIDNNYRIGFNLYQLEKTNKIKDINLIVDENTKYLDRLNSINIKVEREINNLLNK